MPTAGHTQLLHSHTDRYNICNMKTEKYPYLRLEFIKRKQKSKKTRKHAFDQESEKKENKLSTKIATKKNRKKT